MRLGQLARKYDIPQEKIISFLDNSHPEFGPFHNNSKLSEAAEELIINHFGLLGQIEEPLTIVTTESVEEEIVQENTTLPEVAAFDESDEADIQAELDPTLPPLKEPELVNEEEEEKEEEPEVKAIETDKLIEILESEEDDIDLSDITLIKAPKKELEGLKVVGKIDLPEPRPKKEKEEEESAENEIKKTSRPKRNQRRELSAEEKEKRRLRAKKKKEEYEARQARRRKEAAEQRKKELKRAYYEKKISKAKPAKTKAKEQPAAEEPTEVTKPQTMPKSKIGKAWRWFWRGEKL